MKMLRQRRKEMGLTMKQLGIIVGVSEAAISQYETGKRQADFEMQLKLSDALDCSVDYLLRGFTDVEKEKNPILGNEDGSSNLSGLDKQTSEIIRLYLSLSDDQRQKADSYIRFLSQSEDK